jgi:hypothetical protein
VPIIFPIPHRPTKLLIELAVRKSLKILEVASRALASLLITERGNGGNRVGNRAAAEATLATSLRFSLGKRAKKIPTDKSWDFEYWWRRRVLNPRPQALRNRAQVSKFAWRNQDPARVARFMPLDWQEQGAVFAGAVVSCIEVHN